jgi:hypothetical protein
VVLLAAQELLGFLAIAVSMEAMARLACQASVAHLALVVKMVLLAHLAHLAHLALAAQVAGLVLVEPTAQMVVQAHPVLVVRQDFQVKMVQPEHLAFLALVALAEDQDLAESTGLTAAQERLVSAAILALVGQRAAQAAQELLAFQASVVLAAQVADQGLVVLLVRQELLDFQAIQVRVGHQLQRQYRIRQTQQLDTLHCPQVLPRNVRVPLQTGIYATTAPQGLMKFIKAVHGTALNLHTRLAILLSLVVVVVEIAETAAAVAAVEFWLQMQTCKLAQRIPSPLVLVARSTRLVAALLLEFMLRQTVEALVVLQTPPVVAAGVVAAVVL